MVSTGSTRSSSYSVRQFTPRRQFRFTLEGIEMFGRGLARRPVTSPARMKQLSRGSSRRRNDLRFPEPEDVIAMAQSPSPDYLQETIGSSLMLLKKGYTKVRPAKFLELNRIAQQQNAPLLSPRGTLPTPRLVKQISQRVQGLPNNNDKGTQYNYRTDNAQPELAARRPKTVGEVVVDYIKSSNPRRTNDSHSWKPRNHKNAASQYTNFDDFSERCVRCAIFPDIQIDGRSLSKNLTNSNVVMSKEHCEILGPDSCPDCVKIRSQKSHEKHCKSNTSSVPTDVYKLALIYEHSPNLSMREVKRKVYDGEICDAVQRLPKLLYKENENLNLNIPIQSELPAVQVTYTKPSKDGSGPAQQYTKSIRPSFETIVEHSESPCDSEDTDFTLKTPRTELDSKMTYEKRETEKLRKIHLVPAIEKSVPEVTFREDNVTQISVKDKIQDTVSLSSLDSQNFNVAVKTDNVPKTSILKVKRGFTDCVVPSPNFFFDIADLAGRLRNSEIHERSERLKQRADAEVFLKVLEKADNVSPEKNAAKNAENLRIETASTSSVDSFKPATLFNMAYEPPILFENKGRYLGVKAPSAGRTASAVKSVS